MTLRPGRRNTGVFPLRNPRRFSSTSTYTTMATMCSVLWGLTNNESSCSWSAVLWLMKTTFAHFNISVVYGMHGGYTFCFLLFPTFENGYKVKISPAPIPYPLSVFWMMLQHLIHLIFPPPPLLPPCSILELPPPSVSRPSLGVGTTLLCAVVGAWLHLVLSTKTQQIMDSGQGESSHSQWMGDIKEIQ